jgi:outer membrane murein-binding lipoprotein Lpp
VTHNALSRSVDRVPMWVLQAIAGVVLSGGVAWTTWATVATNRHEAKIMVVETKMDDVHEDIKDIKAGQEKLNDKMDRLLERRSAAPAPATRDGVTTHPLYGRDDHGLEQ